MSLPFVLLCAALCAVWIAPLPVAGRRLPPWPVLHLAAIATAWADGVLQAPAVAALALLAAFAFGSRCARARWLRAVLMVLAAAVAIALFVHVAPGFRNPKLYDGIRFTGDALPFTQYLNFDKGSAGLLLLAAFAPRSSTLREWRGTLATAGLAFGATAVAVFALAVSMQQVAFAPKLPVLAIQFLFANLLLTCIAEEALFRGLLQEQLQRRLPAVVAVALSAVLFGLAHLAGGPVSALLAGLAGLGYAAAYARTRRIEAAVLVHFALNATHFLLFTYPALAGR
jgi:membrane protease YdiL (CAAX protease family)